jgi:hypothetical protein
MLGMIRRNAQPPHDPLSCAIRLLDHLIVAGRTHP